LTQLVSKSAITSQISSRREKVNWIFFFVGIALGIIGLLNAIEQFQPTLHGLASAPFSLSVFVASLLTDIAIFSLLLVQKKELLASVIFVIIIIDFLTFGYPIISCMSC